MIHPRDHIIWSSIIWLSLDETLRERDGSHRKKGEQTRDFHKKIRASRGDQEKSERMNSERT
jgi:hypothetical protein